MTTSVVDSVLRLQHATCAPRARRRPVRRRGSRGRFQRAHTDQVVCRSGEEKVPIHAIPAAMTELAQPADGFPPAEDFFNTFSRPLTDGVAGMSRRPSVQGAALLLERDVRRGLELPQRLEKAVGVIAFVAP